MPQGSLSRRRFLYLGGALAAGSALAARDPLSALASDPQAQTVNLTFWTPGGSAPYCREFSIIARNFEKIHPTIRISKQCGTGSQDFITVLLARIAAGNPPDTTILWDTPVSLGARGALTTLDHLMSTSPGVRMQNWPSAALASCQFKGKTYGLPVTAGTYCFWFNQDWFEKKGIPTSREKFPKTWDDLRKLSKEFTFWKSDRLVAAGYVPYFDSGDMDATFFIWSALNGGQIYDAHKQKYTIDSDENVAMMEYMLSWLNEEYRGDISKVMRSGNFAGAYPSQDPQGRPPAFTLGKRAMIVEGSWFMGDIYTTGPLKFHRYGLASFPVGPHGSKTTAGCWPNWLAIPQGSHHVQEAFQWLEYLSTTGVKLWFTITPDMPANKLVPQTLVPAVTVQHQGRAFALDAMRFFHHQLDIATPMWNSPIQSFSIDQLHKMRDRIMYKQAKPKQALAEAQRACQNQLERTLRSS